MAPRPAGRGGKATAQAVVKLWLGFPPRLSGVRSAGNGPAMRAAVLGVWAANDVERLADLVRDSSRLTHTDPAAEQGALVVALAARHGALHGPGRVTAQEFAPVVRGRVSDPELLRGLEAALACAGAAESPDRFMAALGARGQVSGWVSRTVPAAVYCWLRWPGDFRTAVEQVVLMGGDADTTGAIVGGIVGATVGAEAIPAEWEAGVLEWPRSVTWMRRLARRLEAVAGEAKDAAASGPLPLFWPGLLARNLLLFAVVLAHGVRRLLPPY